MDGRQDGLQRTQRIARMQLDFMLQQILITYCKLFNAAVDVDEILTLAPAQDKMKAARAQLGDYSQRLEAKYGENLRLRAFAVVSLGFDRLVWGEV